MSETATIKIELKKAEPTYVGGVFLDRLCDVCDGTGRDVVGENLITCMVCDGRGLVLTSHGYQLIRWLRERGL